MLSRETQEQLWRDLIARSAAPRDRRAAPTVWPLTVMLTVLVLYAFWNL